MRQVTDLQRMVAPLKVVSDFDPAGDQPAAIDELTRRINAGEQDVVLLGATGTGKTATIAWLAEKIQRPMLILQPNKTLAAQFANELRQFFPANAVPLGRMVYGKRAASSLYALSETLKRRRDGMGSAMPTAASMPPRPWCQRHEGRHETGLHLDTDVREGGTGARPQ